jgi:flagellar motility protein MotE (MotC chaperone)
MLELALAAALLLGAEPGNAPAAGHAADPLHPSPYASAAAPSAPKPPQVAEPAAPHAPEPAAAPEPAKAGAHGEAARGAAATEQALEPNRAGEHGTEPDRAAAPKEAASTGKPKSSIQKELHEPVAPPTIGGKALAEELRKASSERAVERESVQAERARLEKLAAEIGEARAALQLETQRLTAVVKNTAEAGAAKGQPGEGGKRGAGTARSRPGARPGARHEPTPLEALAKTLKAMKPDQAALLLAKVDKPLAVELLRHMKPADAAAVLDKMDPGSSAPLVSQLAYQEAP